MAKHGALWKTFSLLKHKAGFGSVLFPSESLSALWTGMRSLVTGKIYPAHICLSRIDELISWFNKINGTYSNRLKAKV